MCPHFCKRASKSRCAGSYLQSQLFLLVGTCLGTQFVPKISFYEDICQTGCDPLNQPSFNSIPSDFVCLHHISPHSVRRMPSNAQQCPAETAEQQGGLYWLRVSERFSSLQKAGTAFRETCSLSVGSWDGG